MAEDCNVGYQHGKLICYLPITTPTGKVRILRNEQPLASRTNQLSQGDVIEWQISYFANEHRKLGELGKLLQLGYLNKVIARAKLLQLLSEINNNREFFAVRYSISVDIFSLPEDFHGFLVVKKNVPILQKSIDNVLIWVELRHKQRAVGFQPMRYLRIPIECASPNLVGKTAGLKQIVTWEPSAQLLFDTVRAFAIASSKHHNDMVDLLNRVLKHQ